MNEEVMVLLRQTDATRKGHFVFKSGKHCDHYTRPDDLMPHAAALADLADMLAEKYIGQVDVVMGPSFGGDKLALLVAVSMSRRGPEVLWVPTKKDKNDQQIVEPDRDFERFLPGARVLIVEDVTTSGGSPGKVVRLAESHGATVVAVAAIASYGADIAAGSGAPNATVLNVFRFQTYALEDCPQCAACEPIVIDRSFGHGWEFSQEHPDYQGGYITLL
jgi:orotate phosphoribosyltransferase